MCEYPIFIFEFLIVGSVHVKVNLKNTQNEIVFCRLWYTLSILLLVAIAAKLIGLQVDKEDVTKVTRSVD